MAAPTHLEHIGKMIKMARNARGLSQQDIADEAGLRQATIADIELGKSNFEINTLIRIAKALQTDMDITLTPVGQSKH